MEPYKNFKNKYINAQDIFKQKENTYGIFIYWTICPHCMAIKSFMNNYLLKDNRLQIYLLNETGEEDAILFKDIDDSNMVSKQAFMESYTKASLGASEVKDIIYYFVPALLVIKDKKLVNYIVFEDNIEKFLRSYKDE